MKVMVVIDYDTEKTSWRWRNVKVVTSTVRSLWLLVNLTSLG